MSSDTPTGSLPTGGVGDADAAGAAGSGPTAPADPKAPTGTDEQRTAPVDPNAPSGPVDAAVPAPATPAPPVVAADSTSGATALTPAEDEPAEPTDPAEILAAELRALPGVADLHGGLFGEVATYLPGRRVTGIRFGDDRTDVHLVVEWGSTVHDVVDAVRRTTEQHTGGSVDVYVEDVAAPGA